MADIRIKDLTTTASSTASDDFIAVDGTTNGTRKLNAYSPTFGGNVTAAGNISTTTGVCSVGTSTLASGTRLTVDTSIYQGIDIFRADANANYSGIRFRNSANSATNAQIGWTGTTLRLEGTPVEVVGNLTVSGTGNFGDFGVASDFYVQVNSASGQSSYIRLNQSGVRAWNISNLATSGDLGFNDGSGVLMTVKKATGNLLVGTTTDSANGKLQLASHTTSAGGIGFGTDTSLYRNAAGSLVVDYVGGSAPALSLSANGSVQSRFFSNGSNTFLESYTNTSLILRTNQTTALTLDSSQRCILAGALRLNNAYTAGAPTATGYVTLQDSAGNTYKVLVGT